MARHTNATCRSALKDANRRGGSNCGYVDERFGRVYKVSNGDGEVLNIDTIEPEGAAAVNSNLRVNIALVERDKSLRISAEDNETHVFFSALYFAPLKEFGGTEYFIDYGEMTYREKPVRVVAADVSRLKDFDTYNKWYLFHPDDFKPLNGHRSYEQFVFKGIAKAVDYEELAVLANPLDESVESLKRSFEPLNMEYKDKGLPMRRNILLLPVEQQELQLVR